MSTTNATTTVHRYEDETPGAWKTFIDAMHSGEVVEIDQDMWYYWLEVLPPVYMRRSITLPDGRSVTGFGFAEGAEKIVHFWHEGERFFCWQTQVVNTWA